MKQSCKIQSQRPKINGISTEQQQLEIKTKNQYHKHNTLHKSIKQEEIGVNLIKDMQDLSTKNYTTLQ